MLIGFALNKPRLLLKSQYDYKKYVSFDFTSIKIDILFLRKGFRDNRSTDINYSPFQQFMRKQKVFVVMERSLHFNEMTICDAYCKSGKTEELKKITQNKTYFT